MADALHTFPTAVSARRMLDGEVKGFVGSVGWTLWRSVLIGAGMYLGGEREGLPAKALAGSVAVEAFVIGWVATAPEGKSRILPSYEAVLSGDTSRIFATYLARAGLIYGGLHLLRNRKRAFRNALAGAAAIEASVVLHARRAKQAALDSATGRLP